ncbi:MAG: PmoA family protein [Planctomycetales bacterium]|nr:PmoA family protein [Planctomycetales bacterium]
MPSYIRSLAVALGLAATCLSGAARGKEPAAWTLQAGDDRVRVEVDGQLFTEYRFRGFAKPILYPVLGPGQTPMTRSYPIEADRAGEAHDHPHHKSIWFAHGAVNGVDFWSEKGRIEHVRLVKVDEDASRPSITTDNRWLAPDGKLVATDTTTIAFLTLPGARAIDLQVVVHASNGEVKFGDTKEGMMALRTHPNLRLDNDPKRGVTTANGKSVNSQGVQDGAMWGQRAAWVDYWGTIAGKPVGIAIFDHPQNLRHPTTWHARSYGLVAANPFGISYFEGKPKGSGDYTLAQGDEIAFRYRIVLHEGNAQQAGVAKLYSAYAAE